MAAEHLLERAQQRRPLFHPRGAKRHPSVSPTANPTKVKAEKSEALALRKVHPPSLLLVHLDLERRQFLSKSPFDRRPKPALARMSVHQDHQIIGEPGVLDIRPPLNTSDLLRALQHRVHLVEVDVTEQRRNHAPLRIPAKLNAQSDQAERGFRASRTLIGAKRRRQSVSSPSSLVDAASSYGLCSRRESGTPVERVDAFWASKARWETRPVRFPRSRRDPQAVTLSPSPVWRPGRASSGLSR